MNIEELDFDLPPERIARHPTPHRTASRLLVVRRSSGDLADHYVSDLPHLLPPQHLLVVNNTRVVPARFIARRRTGGRIEGLWLSSDDSGTWQVMLQGGSRLRPGELLRIDESGAAGSAQQLEVRARSGGGRFTVAPVPPGDALEILGRLGQVPLPPYIQRHRSTQEVEDRARYQTVYAAQPGAIAAPTAGLHFDQALLDTLRQRGATIVPVTLHVGAGTFLPIQVSSLPDHEMHSEYYELNAGAWSAICAAGAANIPVVAVGTTSARVLETMAGGAALRGTTRMFIYPPYRFGVVDTLLTNFHLPRSTLLAMIYAFGGTELMRRAYAHAIESEYRFYSYGDAMLII